MFSFKKETEKSRTEIAEMMSQAANCQISEKRITEELHTATLSIYSVKIYNNPKNIIGGGRIVSCTVRRFTRPFQYEVTVKNF